MKILAHALCGVVCLSLLQADGLGQRRTRRETTPAQTRTRPDTQKPTPAVPPMPILPDIRNDPDVQAADVALIANITIEELRFDAVPNPTVEFLGKDKTSTVWHTDRFNLPDKVEPGVTYRNVGLRLKITSRLADIDRIVSEALGEIPVSDEGQQAPPSSVNTQPVQTKPVSSNSQKPATTKTRAQ